MDGYVSSEEEEVASGESRGVAQVDTARKNVIYQDEVVEVIWQTRTATNSQPQLLQKFFVPGYVFLPFFFIDTFAFG